MTRSNNGGRLKALQRANYSCQARTPAGYQCGEKAAQVDRATGVVVCPSHFTTSQ